MASLGSFGVSGETGINALSKSQSQSADVAVLTNSLGRKIEGTTHGSETVEEIEQFTGATLPTQTAVDAQNGADVILSDSVSESSTDYAKQTISTTKYPGPVV